MLTLNITSKVYLNIHLNIHSNIYLLGRKRLKIADPTLVPYSSRHTMKDKLRTLRTPEDIQDRILGHGSKSDADGYGDGNPLAHLQEVLVKAEMLNSWGL